MDPIDCTTLEVGPAVIRTLDGGHRRAPTAMADAALQGIDDPVVLLDERPVDVDALLRAVLAAVLGEGGGAVTVVHPSWWPTARTARLVAAAATAATSVDAVSRSAWIRQCRGADAVVIEVAGSLVAVSGPAGLTVHSRPGAERIVDAVGGAPDVVLDDPHRTATAEEIRKALRAKGMTVHTLDLAGLSGSPALPRPRRGRRSVFVAALLTLAGASTGIALLLPDAAPPVAVESVSVVEGRVALRVPAGWSVRRVTAGPGSARVEIGSPGDPAAALHVTQAYTPDTTLEATVTVLRRAAAALPRGVFTDIAPTELHGRAALAYREIRPGRVIDWSVLLDGDTRIAIGCQSAAGREDTVRAPCEQAILSARELVGTDRPPGTSN